MKLCPFGDQLGEFPLWGITFPKACELCGRAHLTKGGISFEVSNGAR